MKRTVAYTGLWLLTCGCTPVEREPSAAVVAEPAPLPAPPRSALSPPTTAGAGEPEDMTENVSEDMSEEPVYYSPAQRPPCDQWMSDRKQLCTCLERHHRRSLGAKRTTCGHSTHSRLVREALSVTGVESGEPGGAVCYLVEKSPRGFAVIVAGSALDSTDDCEFGGYSRPLADGGDLLIVHHERTARRVRREQCKTTVTSTTTDTLLCVREPGSTSPTVCGLTIPVKRESVTAVDCDDPKKSRTFRRSVRLDVDFRLDGFVSTRLAEGERKLLRETADAAWLAPRTLPVRGPKP